MYSPELEGSDLDKDFLEKGTSGDYNEPLHYVPGKKLYEFGIDMRENVVTVTRGKGISFDQILAEKDISKFFVYDLRAENVHDSHGETVAFTYNFKYLSPPLNIFPRN